MMTTKDTEQALLELATDRTIFHSEADFQHALAWSIRHKIPDLSVRLEVPIRTDSSSEHLDLLVSYKDQSIAVELKYKTRQLSFQHGKENFDLTQQGAQDSGRYDFLADIARLERFVAEKRVTAGCAILLTNDRSYWSNSKRIGAVDENFRLTEGRELHGSLAWQAHASAGTTRNRTKPITLRGKYTVTWRDYSNLRGLPNSEFRYLAVHVDDV